VTGRAVGSIGAGEEISRSDEMPAASMPRSWGITRWSKDPTVSL
jgi:hypothetical protein